MSEDKKNTQNRPYAIKSSAIRAARQAGMVDGQYEVYSKKEIGKAGKEKGKEVENWYWRPTEVHESVKKGMEEHAKRLEEKYPEKKIETPKPPPAPIENDIPKKPLLVVDTTIGEKVPEGYEPAVIPSKTSNQPFRTVKKVPANEMPEDGKLHRSRVPSPTKLVWHIADEMFAKNPDTTRRQVIEECTKRGIAFYTARTQFQQWLTTRKESEENARKANAKVKKK